MVHGEHFPALGVVLQSGSHAAELSFDLQTRSVAIKARNGGFSLAPTADSASAGDASVLGAELQYSHGLRSAEAPVTGSNARPENRSNW